jgi:hypothetical protein
MRRLSNRASIRFLSLFFLATLTSSPATALCVINDSVLPLALLGSETPTSQTRKSKKISASEKACQDEKKKETISSEWYRGNFYGLDDD